MQNDREHPQRARSCHQESLADTAGESEQLVGNAETRRDHRSVERLFGRCDSCRDSPLHLVHAGCGSRIQQPRRCPKHGEIPSEQIVKAFEFAPDDDIELTEDELNQLKANDDQTIHVERILSARQFDLFLLSGRTLNLIPAHAAAADAYQLVVAALARADEWGLGRLVMSDRQQLIGLRVVDQRLALHVLHWPGAMASLSGIRGTQVTCVGRCRTPISVSRFVAETLGMVRFPR